LKEALGIKSDLTTGRFTEWDQQAGSWVQGKLQTYEAGGYSQKYELKTPEDWTQYFRDVYLMAESNWLDMNTRAVMVDVALYDPVTDQYVSATMLFELPLSNAVTTSAIVRPMSLGFDETTNQNVAKFLEIVRAVAAGLILVITVRHEINHKLQRGIAFWKYPLTYGLVDSFILASTLMVTVVRFWFLPAAEEDPAKALMDNQSFGAGYIVEQLGGLDALVFLFSAFRFCAGMRMMRPVLFMLRMLGHAFREYVLYAVVFVPAMFGFVFLGYSIWHQAMREFSSIPETLKTLIVFIRGDLDLLRMYRTSKQWTPIFASVYVLFFAIFIVNGTVGIIVWASLQSRIREGDPWKNFDHRWTSEQWSDWLGHQKWFGGKKKRKDAALEEEEF